MDEGDQRQHIESFNIKEYHCLEAFNKIVMASLIESAKVVSEDCLEVTWKFQDIFEKILTDI